MTSNWVNGFSVVVVCCVVASGSLGVEVVEVEAKTRYGTPETVQFFVSVF